MLPALVDLAHQCTTATELEAGVLGLLDRHVGFDVAFFSVKGREERPTVSRLEPRVVEQAVRGGATYDRELLPVKRAALAARGVAVDTEVLGERTVRRSRYYREVAARVGGRHSLLAYVPWRAEPAAAIMLGRTGGGFSAAEVRSVEALLPGLGVARAAWGWPRRREPLPAPPARSVVERLGLGAPHLRAEVVTAGGTLSVRDHAGFRDLVATDGARELVWTRAALDDAGRSGWPYVELLHLAPVLARGRERALFIGCGGGVAVRQFVERYPGIAIDVVELEPAVLELARSWFGLGSLRGVSVHVADGYRFVLEAAPNRYDLAVIDAYDGRSVAMDFVSPTFFRALAQTLVPGGAAAFNVIGALAGNGPVTAVVDSARAAFADVRVVPVLGLDEALEPEALRNVVVVAAQPRA